MEAEWNYNIMHSNQCYTNHIINQNKGLTHSTITIPLFSFSGNTLFPCCTIFSTFRFYHGPTGKVFLYIAVQVAVFLKVMNRHSSALMFEGEFLCLSTVV